MRMLCTGQRIKSLSLTVSLLLLWLVMTTGCGLLKQGREPTNFSTEKGWKRLHGWEGEDTPSIRRQSAKRSERRVDSDKENLIGDRKSDRGSRPDDRRSNADLVAELQSKNPKDFRQLMDDLPATDPRVSGLLAETKAALAEFQRQTPVKEKERPTAARSISDDDAENSRTPRNSLRASAFPVRRRRSPTEREREPAKIDPPQNARRLDKNDEEPTPRASNRRIDRRSRRRINDYDRTHEADDESDRTTRGSSFPDQSSSRRRQSSRREYDERQTSRDEVTRSPRKKREYHWRELLNQSIAELQDKLKDKDVDRESSTRMEVALRLMSISAGHKEDGLATIKGLPEPWQEFWKQMGHSMFISMDASSGPIEHRHAARALRPLLEAKNHLSSLASLDVKNASFCSRVVGYGEFTPFAPYRFAADQEVLLYVEVENFVAAKHKKGYETELSGVYQIMDNGGQRVAEHQLPVDKQHCQNLRRDYFIAYRMHMPKKIAKGSYTLQLTVKDEKGKKFGHASLPFEIANAGR